MIQSIYHLIIEKINKIQKQTLVNNQVTKHLNFQVHKTILKLKIKTPQKFKKQIKDI